MPRVAIANVFCRERKIVKTRLCRQLHTTLARALEERDSFSGGEVHDVEGELGG